MRLQILSESLPNFEYHKSLNPRLWKKDVLIIKVRKKLEDIADFYIKSLGIDKSKVQDVLIVGSNANYNWTPSSDIDLHIILDIKNKAEYDSLNIKKLLDAKKSLLNSEYNITIDNIPVEVYFQFKNEPFSNDSGKYSVKFGKWENKPIYKPIIYDESSIKKGAEKIKRGIATLIAEESSTVAQYRKMKEKIKALRASGMHENREFALNNLIFKYLRNTKIIDIFHVAYGKKISKELSLSS